MTGPKKKERKKMPPFLTQVRVSFSLAFQFIGRNYCFWSQELICGGVGGGGWGVWGLGGWGRAATAGDVYEMFKTSGRKY